MLWPYGSVCVLCDCNWLWNTYLLAKSENKTGLKITVQMNARSFLLLLICLCLDFRMRLCDIWIEVNKRQIHVKTIWNKYAISLPWPRRRSVNALTHSGRMRYANKVFQAIRISEILYRRTNELIQKIYIFARIFWMRSL